MTTTWEDIYAQGQQLNLWPFSDLVSAIIAETAGRDRRSIRILELGCGAGNNIYFLAKTGFDVSGIDGSRSAIAFAQGRLASEQLSADLRVGDLTELPFHHEQFDYVIDRAALTHNHFETIKLALACARDVLKPSGKIFSFDFFGEGHPDKRFGTEISFRCYDNFTDGYFTTAGLTSFLGADDLRNLFEPYRDVNVRRKLVFENGGLLTSETFDVSATK